jgi:hypothetical protein
VKLGSYIKVSAEINDVQEEAAGENILASERGSNRRGEKIAQ